MSRTYENKKGESIEVSDEHIDVAVEIAEELKKNSPSGRISWVNHKRMMEEEGFEDSDSNENYRCMIKTERKKRGILPKVEKYADMVVDSKLQSIKSAIGEIKENQLSAREDFNRLNKIKREWTRDILLVESVQEYLKGVEFTSVDYTPDFDNSKTVKKMVAGLSDMHYGYQGENYLNKYDPKIAEELLMKYADKLIEIGEKENVDEIYVENLGDLVEGNLRNQSIFDTQQTLMKQTVEATNVVLKFLVKLSKYFIVKYSGIAGNHDRITQNVKNNLSGDNVMVVSNAIVKTYCNASDSNVEFIDMEDDYFGFIEYFGRTILCVHGDRTPMFKDSTLAELSTMYGRDIDMIVGGHFHRHVVREVGDDKWMAIFGSIKGVDDFSIKIGKSSCRSQGIILFDPNGEFDIRQVKL